MTQQIKEHLAAAGLTVVTFLSPIFGIMFLVGCAIIMDTVTGIWKAKKKKQKVTSKGLQSLVAKMFFYQGVVVLLYLLDHFILNDVVALFWDKIPYATTKLVSLVLVWIEVLSINENYEEVKGISIIDRVKKMVGFVKKAKDEISNFKGKDKEEESTEEDSEG